VSNLFFPQLSTGAIAQYPIKRIKTVHTVVNGMEDGSRISYSDPDGSTLIWDLMYTGLTQAEVSGMQALFEACCGPLRAFTFIDPTANLLSPVWQHSPLIAVQGSSYTNQSSSVLEISQTFAIPAGYQYCFSVVSSGASGASGSVALIRRGPNSQQRDLFPLAQQQMVSSGVLADSGATFMVAIELQPGQTFDVEQAQLEAQVSPSTFRPASNMGGIYPTAHWAVNELLFQADAPDSFSTSFAVEAYK
jgi:hypothetical protein